MSAVHGGNVWQGAGPSEWLDFSANIRPQGPPEWVKRAMLEALDFVSYYPPLDMRRARRGIADFLGLSEELVTPCAGGVSAISAVTRLALERGMRRAVLVSPCFGEYAQAAKACGLPFEYAFACDMTSARLPWEDGRALEPGSLVWLTNPMNPLGRAFTVQEAERLLDLAEGRNCLIAADEAFIDYCPEFSWKALLEDREDLIITGSFTKILGIPGARLGYICGRGAGRAADYLAPWELNCFAESVAIELPRHAADIASDAALNALRRESLKSSLEELGLFVYESKANFLLARLRSDAQAAERELKKKKILVRLCTDFKGADDGRHMRLAVKDEAANAALTDALREMLLCAENR